MLETLVALLTAHVLADFLVQTDAMVAAKDTPKGMAQHIACVVILAGLAIGSLNPPVLGVIFITHLAMDLTKTHLMQKMAGWLSFTLDQVVHLAVIVALAVIWPDVARQGFWGQLPADLQSLYYSGLIIAAGLTVAVLVGGIVMDMMMRSIVTKIGETPKGIDGGGRLIGWLERALIFFFIVYGQPEGVGLLLGAKSILRFGDIQQAKEQAHTEYVIIGTMLSFGWALIVAVVSKAAVAHWR
uniref:DUF3307 domain-containing protein n=1 Tax=Caulobacter sp. (strain K31) TaxID=366602 RepID=B0SXS9_CAUSK